jgi:hypothetical protein
MHCTMERGFVVPVGCNMGWNMTVALAVDTGGSLMADNLDGVGRIVAGKQTDGAGIHNEVYILRVALQSYFTCLFVDKCFDQFEGSNIVRQHFVVEHLEEFLRYFWYF